MQARVYTMCVCVWYAWKYIWFVCAIYYIYVICHIYGIFFISPYIYIERALHFYLCTCYDKSVFEK